MAIQIIHVGTAASSIYSTAPSIVWNLSPAPTPGNGVIVPWIFENATGTTVYSPTCTDNQGNTYQTVIVSSDTSGSGGVGGLSSGIFYCPNVTSSGTFTVTVASGPGGSVLTTVATNHIEVKGIASVVDQTGTYSSAATLVASASVTSSGANSSANELIVAVICGLKSAATAVSDPPSAGYTSIANQLIDSNSLTVVVDSGYKIVSAIETSTGSWTMTTNNALATASIATFQASPTVVVQVNSGFDSTGTQSKAVSFSSTPSVGHAVIVVVSMNAGGPVATVVDNQTGNTFVNVVYASDSAGSYAHADSEIWWCPALKTANGTYTITVTQTTGGGEDGVVGIAEVSGLSGVVDFTNTAHDTAGANTGLTVTNGNPNIGINDLTIANISTSNDSTSTLTTPPGTGFTLIDYATSASNNSSGSGGYKIYTGSGQTGSATWSWGTAGYAAGVIATFRGYGTITAPIAWII